MTRDDIITTLARIKKQVDSRRSIRRVLIKPDGRVVKKVHRGAYINNSQKKETA